MTGAELAPALGFLAGVAIVCVIIVIWGFWDDISKRASRWWK